MLLSQRNYYEDRPPKISLDLQLLKSVLMKKKSKGKNKFPTNRKHKIQKEDKGKCFHCNENGHWKRNCPKYLAEKKAEKTQQGKYDLLVV